MSVIARVLAASAGTGKTFRLSLEYVRLALLIGAHNGYADVRDCAQILVLTFTRKATAEIRQKILEHLAALSDSPQPALERALRDIGAPRLGQQERAWLRAVRRGLLRSGQNFRVSTIDSFVGAQFAEFIAPSLGLLDWSLETQTPDEVYADTMRALVGSPRTREALRELFERYRRHGRSLESYLALVRSVVDNRWLVRLMQSTPGIDLPQDEPYQLNIYRQRFVSLLQRLQKAGCTPQNCIRNTRSNRTHQALRELLHPGAQDSVDWEAVLAGLSDGFLREHRNGLREVLQRASEETAGEYAFYETDVYPVLLAAAAAAVADELPMLLAAAGNILDAYDSVRLASGTLSHQDVTQYTWEALHAVTDADGHLAYRLPRSPGESLNALRGQFYEAITRQTRFLLIDEFQDTSIAQFQLLRPILDEYVSGEGRQDYSGFVVVGDEKQSIYGWRGGESELLRRLPEMYKNMVPGLEVKTLEDNWRSAKVVNTFVNRVFGAGGISSRLWQHKVEWPYKDVNTARTELPGYVQVRFADKENGEGDGPERFVSEVVLPAWQNGQLWGEVAILATTNRQLASIAARLSEAGVPCRYSGRDKLLEHRLIAPLLALFRWAARRQVFDLLAFLRSDWVGLCSADFKDLLLALRDEPNQRTARVFEKLAVNDAQRALGSTLAALCEQETPLELFHLALRTLGVNDIATGEDDRRALEAFREVLRRYGEEAEQPDLSGLGDWLLERDAQNELPLPARLDAAGPVLMTVHQSKGLGFDHVLVYMEHRSVPHRPNDLELHLCRQFGAGYSELTGWVAYTGVHASSLQRLQDLDAPGCKPLQDLLHSTAMRDMADDFNALYVALTRAKNGLYLFNMMPVKRNTWQGYTLQDGFKAVARWLWDILDNPAYIWQMGAAPPPPAQAHQIEAPLPMPVEWQHYLRALPATLEDAAEEDHLRRMRASFMRQAPTLGELVHDWLALVPRGTDGEMQRADEAVRVRYGARFGEAYLRRLFGWLRGKVAASELFAPRWGRVLCEQPVYSDHSKLYRIDRIQVDEAAGEVLVIDFKTGGVQEPRWQEGVYPALVRALPWVQPQWRITFRYVTLDVNEVATLPEQ